MRNKKWTNILCRAQLKSLVYYIQAKNEKEAKIKVQKELNKLNHHLLLDMPLTRINVIEINDLDIKLESSENKIISILNKNLRWLIYHKFKLNLYNKNVLINRFN